MLIILLCFGEKKEAIDKIYELAWLTPLAKQKALVLLPCPLKQNCHIHLAKSNLFS